MLPNDKPTPGQLYFGKIAASCTVKWPTNLDLNIRNTLHGSSNSVLVTRLTSIESRTDCIISKSAPYKVHFTLVQVTFRQVNLLSKIYKHK
jgi:hypothetical protein